MLVNRKELIRKYRDHLNAKDLNQKLVTQQLTKYINGTNHYGGMRDSSLHQASQEIERLATKLSRLRQERDTISAYNQDMEVKRRIVNTAFEMYPILKDWAVDSERDVRNLSFNELLVKYK